MGCPRQAHSHQESRLRGVGRGGTFYSKFLQLFLCRNLMVVAALTLGEFLIPSLEQHHASPGPRAPAMKADERQRNGSGSPAARPL